jgi:excisionase family DNA binding protein
MANAGTGLQEAAAPPPIAYPIERVPAVTGLTRTKVYEAVRAGRLAARKVGRSTLIEHAELMRFVQALPVRAIRGAEAAA